LTDRIRQFTTVFGALATTAQRGTYYRAVRADRVGSVISTLWSQHSGGRYNQKHAFEALYLADTPETALFEVEAMMRDDDGKIHGTRFQPRTIVSVDVSVSRSVSLTGNDAWTALGVSEDDLYLPWRVDQLAGPTLTQQLGAAARTVGIEAVIVPSEKARGAANIVVFVDRLRVGSEVRIFADGVIPEASITGTIR
jgi:RES domain-containing protein